MEIEIQINGRQEKLKQQTILQCIEAKELPARSLVVELNGRIIKQQQWANTSLAEGDVLELLNFVGGG